MITLSFNTLREVSGARNREAFQPCGAWTTEQWCTAIAGEVGEMCNFVKKAFRGDYDQDPVKAQECRDNVLKELADVVIYCDLLAAHLGANLGEEIVHKFNEVSQRVGSPRRLPLEIE